MDTRQQSLAEKYGAGLQKYLAHRHEENLQAAYELGRKALADGQGLLSLAKIHIETMRNLFCAGEGRACDSNVLQAIESFMLEALSPFEVTHRGFGETNRKLRELNEILTHRNQELAVMNRRLQKEIGERKRTEAALRESEEHYRILFNEARQMQENLRNLSSQSLQVQEEERKSISRELHDEVGQSLTVVNMQLELLRQSNPPAHPQLQAKIADAQAQLQRTMETVHRFSRELRPPILDDLGLVPALRSHIKAFAGRTSLKIRFAPCSEAEQMSSDKKLALYRVAQESLTNVAKHAKATRVLIKLYQNDQSICMEVKDNGQAFAVEPQLGAKRKKRLGLLGMQERVRLVQGEFALESTPGKGTIVRVQVPLKKRAP